MAGTITWEQLKELARFRADKGCAVSLYIKLDPSETPTPRDVETRVNSLLNEAERSLGDRRDSLTHRQREALKADLDRIRSWFDDGFERDGSHGLAIFAAGLDNLWSTLTLPDAVPDQAKINSELYLAPLAPLVGRGDGVLVGAVSRERGQLYRLDDGSLVEIADETEEIPGQHDEGGWSQARFQRHIDEVAERHWRRVAATLDSCVRDHPEMHVVLVGSEDMRSLFEELLSNEVKQRLLGWTTAEAHAGPPELLAVARPLVDEWWLGREGELIERWRAEAAKNGRASTGWEQTLEAASDGRVECLLVQAGADHPAYQCPACGRAQVSNGGCPLDGTTMESRENGVDLAVHRTLAHGGTVQVITERHDLEPVGGVGALLRF